MMKGKLIDVRPTLLGKRLRLSDGKELNIYENHPSIEDIDLYVDEDVHLDCKNGTVHDFFSEKDASYEFRHKLSSASAFEQRNLVMRRSKLNNMLKELIVAYGDKKKALDGFNSYPYSVMVLSSENRPFNLQGAIQIGKINHLPAVTQCRGIVQFEIMTLEDKSGGGHTCFPKSTYIARIISNYRFPADMVRSQYGELVETGELCEVKGMVMSRRGYRCYSGISRYLRSVLSRKPSVAPEYTHLSEDLNDAQRKAVEHALRNPITVVSGAAGTGKTRMLQEIARISPKTLFCAPTGKAARRIGNDAKTIHSLLKLGKTVDKNDKSDESEEGTEDDPEDKNLLTRGVRIALDEASMLDETIMREVAAVAMKYDVFIIFVGDACQLPSVEWGNVFENLITWAKKTGNLIEMPSVFRQGEESGILRLATAIRLGHPLPSIDKTDVEFIETKTGEETLATVALMYRDAQIITSKLANDPVSTSSINYKITKRWSVEVGDKVICMSNQVNLSGRNGDIGYVQSIEVKSIADDVKKPKRQADKKTHTTEDVVTTRNKTVATIKLEDGNICTALLKDVKHAYAITVHKSQGSEWDTVVLALSSFQNCKMLYTAVTRARSRLIIVGSRDLLRFAARRAPPFRYSLQYM